MTTNYYERNFDPWTLRAVEVKHEDFSEWSAELGVRQADSIWIYFWSRLGIDRWFYASNTYLPPDIEISYHLYDQIEGAEYDVMISYAGAAWADIEVMPAMFASIQKQFAETSDHSQREALMKQTSSELENLRHHEEQGAMAEFTEKMADSSPAVKIVLVSSDGSEDVMGVYTHGVVMEGPDTLVDVASSTVILRRHPLYGWFIPVGYNQGDHYKKFFIQGANNG